MPAATEVAAGIFYQLINVNALLCVVSVAETVQPPGNAWLGTVSTCVVLLNVPLRGPGVQLPIGALTATPVIVPNL